MLRRLYTEPKPMNPAGQVSEEGLDSQMNSHISQQRILSQHVDVSETKYVAFDRNLFLLIISSTKQSRRLSEPIHFPVRLPSSSGKTTVLSFCHIVRALSKKLVRVSDALTQ
jgi:hypothetical protein